MTTGIETERKFALAKGQALPGLDGLGMAGESGQYDVVSIYYDTPDYRLNAARKIIRRRTGGPDAGWHAKLPTDNPDERVEIQLPLGGERLPRELRDLVAEIVAEQPLYPVAELRTRRAYQDLLAEDGAVLARISADQVTAIVAGRSREWCEAEAELVTGPTALLDRIEACLAQAGILRSSSPSKLAQALAEEVGGLEAAAPSTVAEVILRYMAVQVGVIQSLEVAVVRDEPDAVHRSRVATRRLRSTLRTFESVFRPGAARSLREELRWHAELLGAPRDTEVLIARIEDSIRQLGMMQQGVGRDVLAALQQRHAKAHEALVTSMLTDRYRRLQLSMERLLAEPPFGPSGADPATMLLPGMFDQAVARVRTCYQRATARPADLTRWHEVRKAAKAARYAAELLADSDADAVAAWTAVTTAFGEAQDAVIAMGLIADLSWEAVQAGHSRAPYDELRSSEDATLRAALAEGEAALTAVL